MQPQKSSGVPALTPSPAPQLVPPVRGSSSTGKWIVAGLVVAAAVGGLVWQRRQAAAQQAAGTALTVVRTAQVADGRVERTLRLTGATGALRYASLTAPIMRGGDRGRTGPSGNIGRREGGGGAGGRGGGGGGAQMMMAGGAGGRGGGGRDMQAQVAMASGDSGGGGNQRASSTGGVQTSGTAGQSTMSAISVTSTSSAAGGSSARNTSGRASSAGTRERASTGGRSTQSVASSMGISGGRGGGGNSGGGGGGGGGNFMTGGGRGDFGLTLQTMVRSGSLVKKGDIVAEFDRETMQLRLDDFRASVAQSESAYKAMAADLDVSRKAQDQSVRAAEGDFQKAQINLKTTPVSSKIQAEQLKLAVDEADAQLKQVRGATKYIEVGLDVDKKIADIELKQTKLELQRSETNLDKMIIRAPIDGLAVAQTMIRGGEMDMIKAGDQVPPGMPFLQIVDPSEMTINAVINQADADMIRIGQKARVRFDAFPDLELPANVYSIGTVTRTSRFRPDWVKEMPVVLRLEKMDPRVIPDLSVSVDVILETSEQAPVVPVESVFREGDGADGKRVVYVRVGAGEFQRREVRLGMASNVHVAVLSGVKPGEVVALEAPAQPKANMVRS